MNRESKTNLFSHANTNKRKREKFSRPSIQIRRETYTTEPNQPQSFNHRRSPSLFPHQTPHSFRIDSPFLSISSSFRAPLLFTFFVCFLRPFAFLSLLLHLPFTCSSNWGLFLLTQMFFWAFGSWDLASELLGGFSESPRRFKCEFEITYILGFLFVFKELLAKWWRNVVLSLMVLLWLIVAWFCRTWILSVFLWDLLA